MGDIAQGYMRGRERHRTKEYRVIEGRLRYLRKRITHFREQGNTKEATRLLEEHRATRLRYAETQPKDQMDPNFRRLKYIRYADDFLIGTIGPIEEAREIMKSVIAFLKERLALDISEEKSGIIAAQDGVTYLGYEVRVRQSEKRIRMTINTTGGQRHILKRTLNGDIELRVPREQVRKFCQKNRYGNLEAGTCHQVPALIYRSDAEILTYFNAQMRGFATFYCLAGNAKNEMSKVLWIWKGSLYKTLAAKHKTTVNTIRGKLREGREYGLRVTQGKKTNFIRVYSLKLLTKPDVKIPVDTLPNVEQFLFGRSELMERLNRNQCEYCGRSGGYMEAHHVRKLSDVKQEPRWKQVMIAMRRKVIIMCIECHDRTHAGTLPSWMRNARSSGEPCVSKGTSTVRRGGDASPYG